MLSLLLLKNAKHEGKKKQKNKTHVNSKILYHGIVQSQHPQLHRGRSSLSC